MQLNKLNRYILVEGTFKHLGVSIFKQKLNHYAVSSVWSFRFCYEYSSWSEREPSHFPVLFLSFFFYFRMLLVVLLLTLCSTYCIYLYQSDWNSKASSWKKSFKLEYWSLYYSIVLIDKRQRQHGLNVPHVRTNNKPNFSWSLHHQLTR